MSAQSRIKTACPVCKAAYKVPDSSVGHRARCPKCDSVFRVLVPLPASADESTRPNEAKPARSLDREPVRPPEAVPHPSRDQANRRTEQPVRSPRVRGSLHPSDDDIVGWLMEDSDKDDLPLEPRKWQAPPAAPTQPPEAAPATAKASA